MYLFLLFIKAYVVGTHLNCLDTAIQMSTPAYAFLKTIRNKYLVSIINYLLMKSSANLSLKCALIRCIFY